MKDNVLTIYCGGLILKNVLNFDVLCNEAHMDQLNSQEYKLL